MTPFDGNSDFGAADQVINDALGLETSPGKIVHPLGHRLASPARPDDALHEVSQGLRLFDIADPFAPVEVGHYVPDPAPGANRASSNDVTMDTRGLIYLVDRIRGVDIIETSLHN